jgi:hypothetical protein
MALSVSAKPVDVERADRDATRREPPIQTVAAILAAGMSISGAVWNLLYVREAVRALAGRGPAPVGPGLLDFFSIMAFPLAIAAATWAVLGFLKEQGPGRLVAVGMAALAVMLQLIHILAGPTSELFI